MTWTKLTLFLAPQYNDFWDKPSWRAHEVCPTSCSTATHPIERKLLQEAGTKNISSHVFLSAHYLQKKKKKNCSLFLLYFLHLCYGDSNWQSVKTLVSWGLDACGHPLCKSYKGLYFSKTAHTHFYLLFVPNVSYPDRYHTSQSQSVNQAETLVTKQKQIW